MVRIFRIYILGLFSYDQKGSCQCWLPEIKKEKEEAKKVLKQLNAKLKPIIREEYELKTGIRQIGLRNLPGPKLK